MLIFLLLSRVWKLLKKILASILVSKKNHAHVTAKKTCMFCGPNKACYTEKKISCIHMSWRKRNFLVHDRVKKIMVCTKLPIPHPVKSQMVHSYDSLMSLLFTWWTMWFFPLLHIFLHKTFAVFWANFLWIHFIPLVWYILKKLFPSVSLQEWDVYY